MNTFDLQTHSTASDGRLAPRDVVALAAEHSVSVLSLTDHDAVEGIDEAIDAGKKCGVRVIPGLELSVEEHDGHLLGYGIDPKHPGLSAALERFRSERIEGAKKMIENLRGAGFFVEWGDVMDQAGGASVTRPHIARAILGRHENRKKLGSIATSHDFIQAYLSNNSPHYVRRAHISSRDAIALIQKSSGVAVWAHPALHFRSGEGNARFDELEEFLRELIAAGLAGVEAFSPSHAKSDTEFLHRLCQKYNLLRTAGSDFHEAGPHAAHEWGLHSAERPGDYPTYGFPTDDILSRLERAIEK